MTQTAILFLGLLLSTGVAFAEREEGPNFTYRNRKTEGDADAWVQSEVANRRGQVLRLFDFSARDPQLAEMNMINTAVSSKLGATPYAELTPDRRAAEIFRPFLARLEAFGLSAIHIDHHYPFPTVATTSTTVLTVDFLRWLHEAADLPPDRLRAVVERFTHSFAILDHSDADIVLSNYAARTAGDAAHLKKYGPLLAATALYNDYLIEVAPTAREKARVRVFYNILLGMERDVGTGKMAYAELFRRMPEALEFVSRLDLVFPDTDFFDRALYAKLSAGPLPDDFLAGQFFKGSRDYWQQATVLERLAASGTIEKSTGGIREGSIRRVGDVLVVYPAPEKFAFNSSVAVLSLTALDLPLTRRVASVVLISQLPSTGATYMKVRAVAPEVDLNRAYVELTALGLSAAGRAKAGEGAYGLEGKIVDAATLQRDLAWVVGAVAAALPRRCSLVLADGVDVNP